MSLLDFSKLPGAVKAPAVPSVAPKSATTVDNYTGNIDLNNRPIVNNPDGSFSTESSFSVNFDGKEVLLPSIIGGKRVSQKEAIDHYLTTGENLGKFNSVEEANSAAQRIHKRFDPAPLTEGLLDFSNLPDSGNAPPPAQPPKPLEQSSIPQDAATAGTRMVEDWKAVPGALKFLSPTAQIARLIFNRTPQGAAEFKSEGQDALRVGESALKNIARVPMALQSAVVPFKGSNPLESAAKGFLRPEDIPGGRIAGVVGDALPPPDPRALEAPLSPAMQKVSDVIGTDVRMVPRILASGAAGTAADWLAFEAGAGGLLGRLKEGYRAAKVRGAMQDAEKFLDEATTKAVKWGDEKGIYPKDWTDADKIGRTKAQLREQVFGSQTPGVVTNPEVGDALMRSQNTLEKNPLTKIFFSEKAQAKLPEPTSPKPGDLLPGAEAAVSNLSKGVPAILKPGEVPGVSVGQQVTFPQESSSPVTQGAPSGRVSQPIDAALIEPEGAGKTVYHATPTRNVDSIKKNGVVEGMVTDTKADAEEYAQMLRNRGEKDVTVMALQIPEERLSSRGVVTTASGRRIGERFNVKTSEPPYIPEGVRPPTAKEQTLKSDLHAEALNFKTAEEFVRNARGNATQYGKYNPKVRATNKLFKDSERISNLGVDPEKEVTIYRGVPDPKTHKIVDGDFVVTDKQSAESYAGKGNVISKVVKAKDLITDSSSEFDKTKPFGLGAEFTYSDSKNNLTYHTDEQLTAIYNEAHGKGGVRESSPELTPAPESGTLNARGEHEATILSIPEGKNGPVPAGRAEGALRPEPLSVTFKKDGYLFFPKKKITSPEDVAFAFRNLTNSGIEHFFIVSMKGDKAVGVELLTMGTYNAAHPYIYEMMSLLDSTKADGIYLVHNHPTGNVDPSPQDRQLTKEVEGILNSVNVKMLGHVIIDTGKFGFIRPAVSGYWASQFLHKEYAKTKKVPVLKKYFEWSKSKDDMGPRIREARDVYEMSKGLMVANDQAMIFALDNANQVMNIFVMPQGSLTTGKIFKSLTLARAASAIIVNPGIPTEAIKVMGRQLKYANINVLDVLDVRADGYTSAADTGALSEPRPEYGSPPKEPPKPPKIAEGAPEEPEPPQEIRVNDNNVQEVFDSLPLEQQKTLAEEALSEKAMDEYMKTPEANLHKAIKELGGIRPYKEGYLSEELKRIPPHLKNKDSRYALDEIVAGLQSYGWHFESAEDLLNAIESFSVPQTDRAKLHWIIGRFGKNKRAKENLIRKMVDSVGKELDRPLSVQKVKGIVRQATGQVKAVDLVREDEAMAEIFKREDATYKRAYKEGGLDAKEEVLARIERVAQVRAARAEVKKILRDIKSINTSKMSPDHAEAIDEIKEILDYAKPTRKTLQKLSATRKYLESNPEAELPDYVMEELERLDKLNSSDLTLDQLRALHMAVMHHVKLEAMKKMLRIRKEARDLARAVEETIGEMKTGKTINEMVVASPEAARMAKEIVWNTLRDIFLVDQDHYDLVVEALSKKGEGSTIYDVFFQQIKDGQRSKLAFEQGMYDKFHEELGKLKLPISDVGKWMYEKVETKLPNGRVFNLRRGERISLYLHSLNENNLRHLVGGINSGFVFRGDQDKALRHLTLEELQGILSSIDKNEKAIAGINKKISDAIYPKLDEIFYEKNGYKLPKEENYYRIKVATNYLGAEKEERDILDKLKDQFIRVGIAKGFTNKRVKSTAPLVLENFFEAMADHIHQAATYYGLEIPLSNASKLLYDQEWKTALISRYGRETWRVIESALRDIAGSKADLEVIEQAMEGLRRNVTKSVFGLNPSVMIKQFLGLATYNIYVPKRYLLAASGEFISNPAAMLKRHAAYSPEFRDRAEFGFSRDVREAVKRAAGRKLAGAGEGWLDKQLSGLRFSDKTVVSIGMQGAILKKLDDLRGSGMSVEEKLRKAYEYADYVTNRTQSTSAIEHRSQLSRSKNPVVRALTFAAGDNNTMWTLMRRMYHRYQNSRSPADLTKMIQTLFYGLVLIQLGQAGIDWVMDRLYRQKKAPKDPGLWWIMSMANNAAGQMYILRDLVQSATSKTLYGEFGGQDVSNMFLNIANNAVDMILAWGKEAEEPNNKNLFHAIKKTESVLLPMTGIGYMAPQKIIEKIIEKSDMDEKELQAGYKEALQSKDKNRIRELTQEGIKHDLNVRRIFSEAGQGAKSEAHSKYRKQAEKLVERLMKYPPGDKRSEEFQKMKSNGEISAGTALEMQRILTKRAMEQKQIQEQKAVFGGKN